MLPSSSATCAIRRFIVAGCRQSKSSSAVSGAQRSLSMIVGDANPRTKVEKLIRDSIKATGPMSLSTYMQMCLSHPTDGYYMNPKNPVFGRMGDFITSPEISQVFGELLAIWHLSQWHAAGKPPRIRFIELGPGRGTLVVDMLRTWMQFADCRAALKEVYLVETSPSMRALQQATLKYHSIKLSDITTMMESEAIQWCDSLEDVDDNSKVDDKLFTIIVAHEFFDALPAYLIEKHGNEWHEVRITTEPDPASSTPTADNSLPPLRFARIAGQSSLTNFLGALSPRYSSLPDGQRIEVSPVSYKAAHKVAELINSPDSAGGSALIIDYGADHFFGSSLRAFSKHKIVDVFQTPGECDLTTNVDFALLREAVADAATVHGSVTQQHFLSNMNINARVARLVRKTGDVTRGDAILKGARRLVDPLGMGSQYKVLAITGSGSQKPKEAETVWPFVQGKEAGTS